MSKETQWLTGLLFVILGNTTHFKILSVAQYLLGIAFITLAVYRAGNEG